MTLELLISNLKRESEIIREILNLQNQQLQFDSRYSDSEREMVEASTNGLISQLEILNKAIPEIVNNIQFFKKLDRNEEIKNSVNLLQINYDSSGQEGRKMGLGIKKEDKVKFLQSLTLANLKKRFGSHESGVSSGFQNRKSQELLIKASNRMFRKFADKMVEKKYFESLNKDLRKITSPYLLSSYLSMMFFATFIAFVFGVIFALIFLIVGFLPLALIFFFGSPLIAFLLFFNYPSSQRKTLEREINQELPFVTIYMSAVATSGIEPSRIFEILVRTKDYPFTQREIKKILNLINFYGYDLVSALKQSSKFSPSERLALLFSGISTTIKSGGELTEFLNKHAEGLLFDYRLEREKYTKVAETFMDIYISILIAAPMIMMILFILITLTGYTSSLITPAVLSAVIIALITFLNLGFLIFLNLKQPKF